MRSPRKNVQDSGNSGCGRLRSSGFMIAGMHRMPCSMIRSVGEFEGECLRSVIARNAMLLAPSPEGIAYLGQYRARLIRLEDDVLVSPARIVANIGACIGRRGRG